MPIFRYCCQECQAEFELLLARFDSPAECPHCGSEKLEKQLNRVGVLSSPKSSKCAMSAQCPASTAGCCCPGSCQHKH